MCVCVSTCRVACEGAGACEEYLACFLHTCGVSCMHACFIVLRHAAEVLAHCMHTVYGVSGHENTRHLCCPHLCCPHSLPHTRTACRTHARTRTQYTAYIGPGPIYCVYRLCGPELAQGHRVSRPRGTGSVGDSVGEGTPTTTQPATATTPQTSTKHQLTPPCPCMQMDAGFSWCYAM